LLLRFGFGGTVRGTYGTLSSKSLDCCIGDRIELTIAADDFCFVLGFGLNMSGIFGGIGVYSNNWDGGFVGFVVMMTSLIDFFAPGFARLRELLMTGLMRGTVEGTVDGVGE
jgi:hypothetical protein